MSFLFNQKIKPQEFLIPTSTNIGVFYDGRFNMINSIGEIFIGQKNIRNIILIEGFYFYDVNKIDSIDYQLSKCKIFPNPAKGKFVVYNDNNNFNVIVDIYNTIGLKVETYIVFANSLIRTNYLPCGLYFIRISEIEGKNRKSIVYKEIIIN